MGRRKKEPEKIVTKAGVTRVAKNARVKKGGFVPYHVAKYMVETASDRPHTRKGYLDWMKKHKYEFMPYYPYCVYKEWTTWNDFLGNDNEFVVYTVGNWRSYYDAMRYVHGRKLGTRAEYKEAFNGEGWPKDIPGAPHYVYSDHWVDWPTFLGLNIRSRVEAVKEMKQCIALCNISGLSGNVIKILICKGGKDQLQERLEEAGNLTVVKLYRWSEEDKEVIDSILNNKQLLSSQADDEYIVVNMSALLFELDSCLEWWS